jgi:hypothetical protein
VKRLLQALAWLALPAALIPFARAPRRWLALAWLALLVALVPTPRAGLIEPPPAIVAMWDGKDGASVRAALLPIAALGEQPGTSARQRLESGEAAWWLGVQDERAGRADSAVAQWRRAVAMRGDFDEGFALIDALSRRASAPALAEAYGVAFTLADQARMGMPTRLAEAQGRLAWVRHLRGRSDSALAGVSEWSDALRKRPAWTRRLATIEHAAGDHARAWKSLTLLAARTREQDASVESLLVLTQKALGLSDEQRRSEVGALRATVEKGEWRLTLLLAAHMDSLRAKDGFTVRWYRVPATPGAPARPPLLLVLAPDDSLVSADSLAAAFAAAGRSVVLMPPRGAYAALGPGAYGPEARLGRPAAYTATVAEDAARVMNALAQKRAVPAGGWVVGAAGDCMPTGLAIARARKDTRALLLVAPRIPLVEVAEARARLRAQRTRTFVQVSPEEPDALELGDLLSRQTAPGQVRVADSGERGRGVAIFRADPKIPKRLLDWLAETPKK